MKVLLVEYESDLMKNIENILTSQLKITDMVYAKNRTDALQQINNYTLDKEGTVALLNGTSVKYCAIELILVHDTIEGSSVNLFLHDVRKLFDKRKLPVLVITSGNSKEILMKTIQAGANNFIIKPVTMDVLNKKMAEVLKKKISPKSEAAVSIFKKPASIMKKKQPGILSLLSASKKSKAPSRLIGGACHETTQSTTATKKDEQKDLKIDDKTPVSEGHYHEKTDIIGGGINCYWAKEIKGGNKVNLEYLSPKGRPTGIQAKIVSKSDFVSKYLLCTPDVCIIAKRLEKG